MKFPTGLVPHPSLLPGSPAHPSSRYTNQERSVPSPGRFEFANSTMQATRALWDAFERLTDARKQAAKEPKRAAAQNASSKKARSPGLIDTWALEVFSHVRLALEALELRLETRSSGDERWREGCLEQAACSICARLRTGGKCPRAPASLPVGEPKNARGWTADLGVLRWTIREARCRHGDLKTGKNDRIMTGDGGREGFSVQRWTGGGAARLQVPDGIQ